tara:strand:+ start:77 stop:499 length:423 start_codon:yes stop_codon:yes gene_type:complete
MATRDWTTANSKRVSEESVFTDLDLNFVAHPLTGDITTKKDADAIKRAVKNIVLTNHYERPFKPNFGSNLRSMLFELGTPRAHVRIRQAIIEELDILEPRIRVQNLTLNQRDNEVNMTLFYTIVGGAETQSIDFSVRRVR